MGENNALSHIWSICTKENYIGYYDRIEKIYSEYDYDL